MHLPNWKAKVSKVLFVLRTQRHRICVGASKAWLMDFTCAVWYQDALAHYYVSRRNEKRYEARLLHCITPPREQQPPHKVVLTRSQHQWQGDGASEELVISLSHAIEQNLFVIDMN